MPEPCCGKQLIACFQFPGAADINFHKEPHRTQVSFPAKSSPKLRHSKPDQTRSLNVPRLCAAPETCFCSRLLSPGTRNPKPRTAGPS